jgi:Uncharacterized conserved protein
MTEFVPPAKQCTMCDSRAVDPTDAHPLCDFHAARLGGDDNTENTAENPKVPESGAIESGGAGSSNDDPQGERRGIAGGRAGPWDDTDFTAPLSREYPPELLNRRQWMGHVGKKPFAPWGDANPPDAEPDDSPRWEWGRHENYLDGETIAMAEDDPRLDGRVFLQQEDDPFAFVDGDDVRDPDTGDIHPAFQAILTHLGLTYADVSTSGSGSHAYYRAEDGLPIDGKGQATFEIDSEPWGANDSPPTVEIYANKHVCVATGDRVPGTPTEIHDWDSDTLRAILQANGYADQEPVTHDTDRDRPELESHDPVATGSSETTADIRDILKAVDRLQPRDLPLQTRRTGSDSTGWSTWDPGYRASAGGKSVHSPPDEPVFHDHKEGESFGVLGLFAAEEGIIRNPWDRLQGEDWWNAVNAARDAGASIPEFVGAEDTDPVAALGIRRLEALNPADRRRAAQKRGFDVPTTREARQRLRDSVFREMRAENQTVLDAPTALGKSHTVATEPWMRRDSTTGGAPVIQLHTTTDARDEAAAETGESMADCAVLRGRDEMSPVARGDHDPNPDGEDPDTVVTIDGLPASEWFDSMCDDKGLAFSTALALGRDRNDQDLDELPPFGQEDPAVAQWDGIPRDSDGETAVDVVHATHQFAHVPSIRAHTNLVFDEQPDFRRELDQDTIREMVTAYLHWLDAPVTDWEAFTFLAQYDGTGDDAAAERNALNQLFADDIETPEPEWFVAEPDAHALAPAITEGLWWAFQSDLDRNDRRSARTRHEPPRFDADSSDVATSQVRVVVDADNTIQTVRETPHLYRARSVIGLDAYPAMPLWELNTTPRMTRDAVFDPIERRLWRVVERGLTVVQVGDATRPRSGDKAREWMNDDRVRAVLQRLREQYGDGFKTALSTLQTEDDIEALLREVCDGSVIDGDNTMHFGEEKSRNDFAGEEAGYVYGCMDPGDRMVVNTLAELDLDAAPVTATDDDGEVIRDEHGDPVREKGRTFEGDDADTAASVLASVRENHVAQAAGRYARDADSDDGATVFIHTDAAPAGFVDVETPGVEWIATDKQRQLSTHSPKVDRRRPLTSPIAILSTARNATC